MRGLDAFCGAGGCSVGYDRAGITMVGIDLAPQPNYPYPFLQMDALEALRLLLAGEGITASDGRTYYLHDFDFIHASPPCPAYSLATGYHGKEHRNTHPDLYEPTKRLLDATGLPYVIENVPGSPVRKDVVLCGEMFGLRVHRHRLFETSGFFVMQPRHAPHRLKGALHNCHIEEGHTRQVAGNYANHGDAADAMGIDWPMSRRELANAIPPAYTQHIGEFLMGALSLERAA